MSAATTSAAGRLTDGELKAREKAARKAEKARQKTIAADEAAERRRSAKAGFANVNNPRRSTLLTVLCAVFAVYCLFPFVYLLINATKTQADFTSTFGLGFGKTFALFDNIATVFSYQDGIFGRWLLNTLLYVVVGAGGATLLAIMGGYALAKFRFPGRKAVFAVIIGAISVPGIALAVPQFLLFAKLGLTNTPWAMIIPSLISPFGLYLMWIFSEQAVPQELLEAARVDGASEFRTFWQISLPLLAPGIVTTALFTIVATWNNYFLPLIMLKDADWYPLTIGLNQWKDQASTAGGQAIQKPGDHGLPDHDHPLGHRVPVPAEVLAVRTRRRRRQGVMESAPPTRCLHRLAAGSLPPSRLRRDNLPHQREVIVPSPSLTS